MPTLGADMESGTLVEWHVTPGQRVKRGDVVAVVETQKGAVEVENLGRRRGRPTVVAPGAKVPVGEVLAHCARAAPPRRSRAGPESRSDRSPAVGPPPPAR